MDTTKISLNLTTQNRIKLEDIREKNGTPCSKTINDLINTFIGISEGTKKELIKFMMRQTARTMLLCEDTPANSEPFHKEMYRKENEEYSNMLQFFKGEVQAK
jgi:hypothetical protein